MEEQGQSTLSLQEWFAQGVQHLKAERWPEAESIFRQILLVHPDFPEACYNLGLALKQQKRLQEAFQLFRRAIMLRPSFPEPWNSLGDTMREMNKTEEAIDAMRRAVALRPEFIEAWCNLGGLMRQTRQFKEAVEIYRRVVAMRPDQAAAWNSLGLALNDIRLPSQAADAYRRALELRPDLPEVWNNLGNVLGQQHKQVEAIEAYRRALTLHPNDVDVLNNMAGALQSTGQLDETLACLDRLTTLQPDYMSAYDARLCTMHYHPGFDSAAIYREARRWNQRFAQPLMEAIPRHDNEPSPQRRIRIGYVSSDFRTHCESLFTMPLLSHHDHREFEIFCYNSVAVPDSTTTRIQGHADVWRDVSGLNNAELAQRIGQDKIDILVDLTLHMAANRLPVFVRKPVPIQVTWLGYPGTTGLDAIDYRLTDPQLDPPGLEDASAQSGPSDQQAAGQDARIGTREKFYSERSVRLPDCFWCYDPCGAADIDKSLMPQPGPLPALAAGRVTFGCLNNFAKASDRSLDLWARILAATPGSRMLMAAAPGPHRERALRKLGGEDRVQFIARLSRRQYLETYQKIDLCLDPLPCNGGTTSLDALWMGVPLVTLVGRTVVGRAGWTLLHNLGLMELVARTEEEFVQKAVELARDVDRLANLRATLRQRMEQSPLMDGARFARNVESAYRQMWRAWCETRQGNGQGTAPTGQQVVPYSPEIQQLFKDGLERLNTGRLVEAEDAYRRILAQRPEIAEVHFNLGIALLRQRKMDEAIAACRAALALRPDYQEAWNNLGVILRESNRSAEAIPVYRRSLELRPDIPQNWTNLALAMQDTGQLDEARTCYDRAIALQPDSASLPSSRLHMLHYHPAYDAAAIYQEARHWNDRFVRPLAGEIRVHDNDRSPQRRLRIGYVSSDFRVHCQAVFTTPLLTHHDRQAFEIFCYSGVTSPDAVTEKLRSHANGWRDISRMNDQAVAQLIRQDKIDILIDLSLHTAGNRLLLFARKPAPVQATWLGYPGTTGMEAIDYRLTDARLDPPQGGDESAEFATREPFYSERSVRLPDSYWCYDPYGMEATRGADLPEPGPLPALASGHVTFGCLNTFWKVSDPTLALWARVLAAVPDSQMLLYAAPGPHRERVVQKLDVAPQRVRFVSFQPWRQYLATYHQIDLCLDTLPFNGGTTSLDSLWMGVPVLTLIGHSVIGRAGSSHLYNLGLTELVAGSEDQFVETAVQWAGDLVRLEDLRAALRQRMERSPLMDAQRFAGNMEAAYRRMWQIWCDAGH